MVAQENPLSPTNSLPLMRMQDMHEQVANSLCKILLVIAKRVSFHCLPWKWDCNVFFPLQLKLKQFFQRITNVKVAQDRAQCLEEQEGVTHKLGVVQSRGKLFGKELKGSAKAFLAATSSVKSLIFVNPLQKSGDLGTKFCSISVLLQEAKSNYWIMGLWPPRSRDTLEDVGLYGVFFSFHHWIKTYPTLNPASGTV